MLPNLISMCLACISNGNGILLIIFNCKSFLNKMQSQCERWESFAVPQPLPDCITKSRPVASSDS